MGFTRVHVREGINVSLFSSLSFCYLIDQLDEIDLLELVLTK